MPWLWATLSAHSFNYLSAAVAAGFLLAYWFRCHFKKAPADLSEIGSGVLSSGGLVSGVFIILSAFVPKLHDQIPDNALFTMMIGAIVLVISWRVVVGALKK